MNFAEPIAIQGDRRYNVGERTGSMFADLHMHSTASDGTDAPEALPALAKSHGLAAVALTDHDTISGWRPWLDAAPRDILRVPGIEFSCYGDHGKCHILGFCPDPEHPQFQAALQEGADLRRKKLDTRLQWLERHGYALTRAEKDQLYHLSSAGKPHLANLLVEHGYFPDRTTAIQAALNGIPGGNARIPARIAVEAIHASGGVVVWAHPLGGVGERTASPEEFDSLLQELMGYGLQGLECWYSKYDSPTCGQLEARAKELGLLVSGGGDYHGANKQVCMGTLCDGPAPVPGVSADRLTVLPWLEKEGLIR